MLCNCSNFFPVCFLFNVKFFSKTLSGTQSERQTVLNMNQDQCSFDPKTIPNCVQSSLVDAMSWLPQNKLKNELAHVQYYQRSKARIFLLVDFVFFISDFGLGG